MKAIMIHDAYVTEFGDWLAGGRVLTFDRSDLTREQWDNLSKMHEDDRMAYVLAILSGQNVRRFEDEV